MRWKISVGVLILLVVAAVLWWQPPSSRLPVRNEKTVSYFLLGMLDEYLGRRFHEDSSDIVERFRSKRKAKVFTGLLSEYAELTGTDYAFELRSRHQGGLEVASHGYAELLNSYYTFESGEPEWVGALPGERIAGASLSRDAFEGADKSTVLAFLAGAYCRYGRNQLYRYANSYERVILIVELLERVGCENVSLKTTKSIPNMHTIEFEPTAELEVWLDKYSKCEEPIVGVLEAVVKTVSH